MVMMITTETRRKYIFAAIGIMICSFLFAAFFNGLIITKYTIGTNKTDKPVRIVLLADLHSCFYGKNQELLISKINEQNPDIIVMSGDIADDEIPHYGTIKLLEGISGICDCFYVTGNHEFWSGEVDLIKDIFRKYKVSVLEGERKVIEINEQFINICGVDDPDIGEAVFERQLDKAFASIDDSLFTILLSHRSERFVQESTHKFDLVLSGHAHGGQLRIPYILNGLFAPNQGFFPEYTSGVYMINKKKMIVSRGLSRESTRIPRIFNPPEIVVVTIVPE